MARKPEFGSRGNRVLHEKGVVVHVVQGFLHEIRDKHTLSRLYDLISAWEYFSDVMSLKTREGMRNKKRRAFGFRS